MTNNKLDHETLMNLEVKLLTTAQLHKCTEAIRTNIAVLRAKRKALIDSQQARNMLTVVGLLCLTLLATGCCGTMQVRTCSGPECFATAQPPAYYNNAAYWSDNPYTANCHSCKKPCDTKHGGRRPYVVRRDNGKPSAPVPYLGDKRDRYGAHAEQVAPKERTTPAVSFRRSTPSVNCVRMSNGTSRCYASRF